MKTVEMNRSVSGSIYPVNAVRQVWRGLVLCAVWCVLSAMVCIGEACAAPLRLHEAIVEFTLSPPAAESMDANIRAWMSPEMRRRAEDVCRRANGRKVKGKAVSEKLSAELEKAEVGLRAIGIKAVLSVKSTDSALAARLADAYVEVIGKASEEERRRGLERKIRDIRDRIGRKKREREDIEHRIADLVQESETAALVSGDERQRIKFEEGINGLEEKLVAVEEELASLCDGERDALAEKREGCGRVVVVKKSVSEKDR